MGRKSRNRPQIPSQKKLSASNAGMPLADLRVALQQGVALFQSGKLQEAEQLFKSVLAKDKKNLSALQFLGIILFQTGRLREGEQMLRKAIQLNPKVPDLYYNLGMMLDRQDKLEQAVAAYRRALGLGARNEWVQNNLGTVLSKLGRLEDAEETIKGALEINPDNPSVLSNYGLILWRLNRPGDATKALERALDIDEKCVDALTNMGIVCIANSEIDEADRYLRRAIEIDPHNFDAVNNLAVALLHREKSDAALGMIQKALELRPESINVMLTMAKILVKKEDDKGAEECYHKVLEVMPSNTDAIVGIGSILSKQGKFEGAKEFYEKALQVDPQIVGARVGLINIDSSDLRSKEISELEAIYVSGDISDEDKIRIAFSLANVEERAGTYKKAFKYLVDGNSLRRKSFEYCLDRDREFFREIKSSFNEKFFQEHLDSGFHDKSPIFILGMPRSGTTLTEQILSSHPEVYGAGELTDIRDLVIDSCGSVERYETFPDILSKLGSNEYSRMGKDYIAGLRERYGNADRITDKLPHNFLHLGMIRLMLPNAKIIHCKRNPIDNCLSIFKQNFTALHKYSHNLDELSGYYLLYQDLMEHWNRVLPGFMFELQYEDMVADQEGMTRSLLEFCELPWDDSCLQFHKSERAVKTASYTQVRKKIYSDSVQLWKRYEQELQPLISALESNRI